jgi:hypothetical protein
LVCQHDKKFRLLAIGSLHNYPRSDLVRNVERVAPNVLADGA